MLDMRILTDRTQTGKVANPSHVLGLQACATSLCRAGDQTQAWMQSKPNPQPSSISATGLYPPMLQATSPCCSLPLGYTSQLWGYLSFHTTTPFRGGFLLYLQSQERSTALHSEHDLSP